MAAPYRGVLFDLFGTLVAFDAGRLPELEVEGVRHRTTVGGLAPALAEWVPGVSLAAFARALLAVSDELARARAVDHIELPSRERFRRALARVGCAPGVLAEAAVDLSRAHMALIAAATVLPPAHAELLAALRPRYRLGLVSNFDDTGAAYDILGRHGIARPLAAGAVLVCGGLGGVMEAAARGAAEGGGTVIGILPGYDHRDANRHLTVALPTGLGYARNVLVAAAGDALIALPGGHGTLSEVALAQVLGRPVVALGRRRERAGVVAARTPAEAVRRALALARRRHSR